MLDLDHDVQMPAGWQTQWLSRTLPSLRLYTTITSYLLSFTIIALGVGGFVAIRRSTKNLANDPSNRSAIFRGMNKKLLRVTRGHFAVANIYMLHVFAITMVDAVICFLALRDDVSSGSEAWTAQLIAEVAMYCSYLLAIFAAAFILVPLLQMLFITWMLARVSRRNSRDMLADYVPEARFFSTHIAQIWSMLCFFGVSWWAPAAEDASIWRFVALQACLGSTVAWLDASFALNFRFDRLADKEFKLSTAGVKEILAMFGQTVKAVHGKSDGGASLPRYEAVVITEPLTKEEKEVL